MSSGQHFPVDHPAVTGISCPVCLVRPGQPCRVGVHGTKHAHGTHKGRVLRFQDAQRAAAKLARTKSVPLPEPQAPTTEPPVPATDVPKGPTAA